MLTFGICTIEGNEVLTSNLLQSIKDQNIPNYEVIVVGGIKIEEFEDNNSIKFISFDESIKSGWITKKKNLITELSNYETIVFLHDYLVLDKNWFEGFKNFKDDFSISTNKILRQNGDRYLDWTLWEKNFTRHDYLTLYKRECLLPYEVKNLSKFMYISGAYFVAKKKVMEEFPLNEELAWREGEDVEWSLRVREKYNFIFNEESIVRMQIDKRYPYKLASFKTVEKLSNIINKPTTLKIDSLLYKNVYLNYFLIKNFIYKALKRINVFLNNIKLTWGN